jgi:hypothetical protein
LASDCFETYFGKLVKKSAPKIGTSNML